MTMSDYEKILQHERKIARILSYGIPIPILIIIFFVYAVFYFGIAPGLLSIIPIVYVPVFFLIYRKKPRKVKSKNSAKFYFKNIGYEKAIIRHEVLDHFHRYYLIILIITGILVGVAFNAIHEGNQEEQLYREELQQKLEKLAAMSDEDVINHARTRILEMRQYELANTFFEFELAKQLSDPNNIKTKYEIESEVEDLLYTLSEDDLQTYLLSNLNNLDTITKFRNMEMKELNNELNYYDDYYFDDPFYYNDDLTLQDFLVSIVTIPFTMVYSTFLLKLSLKKYPDFWYHSAIGCFQIIQNCDALDEMQKQHYLSKGLRHYDNYIKRNLKLRINHLEKISSDLISESSQIMDQSTFKILEILQNKPPLELARHLAILSNTKDESILGSRPLLSNIEGWSAFIISGITTILAVLAFALNK